MEHGLETGSVARKSLGSRVWGLVVGFRVPAFCAIRV